MWVYGITPCISSFTKISKPVRLLVGIITLLFLTRDTVLGLHLLRPYKRRPDRKPRPSGCIRNGDAACGSRSMRNGTRHQNTFDYLQTAFVEILVLPN